MTKYANISVEIIYQELVSLCNNHSLEYAHDAYVTLRNLYYYVLNNKTEDVGFSFSGPFAKLDYLIKENHLSKRLSRAINHLRVKLRFLNKYPKEELHKSLLSDIRLFSEFIRHIYHTPIPPDLLTLLPNDYHTDKSWGNHPVKDVIRVIVNHWDDTYIYANNDTDEEITLCYNTKTEAGTLTEIKEIIQKGSQLNIVRPHIKEGIYYPEFIIYEPDFLVDISSIAESFEEYGLTPYSYLIKKLLPKRTSQAILIGNLAGQFLDEAVYNEKPVPYKESLNRFFRSYSLNLITCPDLQPAVFHKEAIHQQQNLRLYTEKQLDGYRIFDPEKVLLEPSFFCETLGLQGRMDLLTEDKRILIEQKSGKWGWPNGGHQEKHYVQMLFYLAWLRYNQHISTEEINCLLLYSKYPTENKNLNEENGLIKEVPAPELLFKALQLRNKIVWLEKMLQNGQATLLNSLTSSHFNIKNTSNKLWNNYQKPEIERVLATIQDAEEIEKKYFFRMFTFLEKEYHLSKNGFADAWNMSTEEKIQDGKIYTDLTLIQATDSENTGIGVDTITLRISSDSQNNLPNFRQGDIVVLYAYNETDTADMRYDIVFRATLIKQEEDTLTLQLRSPQRNRHIFDSQRPVRWALEHDFLDSSFNAGFKDLFSFLAMTNSDRKKLILNQRKPQIDSSIQLNGDYQKFNSLVLHAKQAKDYFIIIGPPGTGKTSYALTNILKEYLSDKNSSILLVSYTNRAVEEICSKLIQNEIDFIRIGHEHSCTEQFDTRYLLKNKINHCSTINDIRSYLESVRVYVGTTASVSSTSAIFQLKNFDVAIVDEASQILEPQLLGLFTAGNGTAIQKFIFIGDHKQLPAVVQQTEKESAIEDPLLNEHGFENCRFSYFERLLKANKDDDKLVYMLNHQGRMHPEIAEFINHEYYDSLLNFVPLPHQQQAQFYSIENTGEEKCKLNQLLLTHRLLCFHVPIKATNSSDATNPEEATLIVEIVKHIRQLYEQCNKPFDINKSIGIIVPYRSQIALIRKELKHLGFKEDITRLSVDTVERYQGSERDIIIYGTTIKKQYQLDFLSGNLLIEGKKIIDRKLNVAITRAREQMIVVGNLQLLSQSYTYRQFIQFAKGKGCLYDDRYATFS